MPVSSTFYGHPTAPPPSSLSTCGSFHVYDGAASQQPYFIPLSLYGSGTSGIMQPSIHSLYHPHPYFYCQYSNQYPMNLDSYLIFLSDIISIKTCTALNLPTQAAVESPLARSPLPLLRDFILQLVMMSQSFPITLLVVMILLDRLTFSLPTCAVGTAETGHRVCLAAMIIANKFLLDVPVKNSLWSQWTNNYYTNYDINSMERQLLTLLGHNISVTMEELQLQTEFVQRHQMITKNIPLSMYNGSMKMIKCNGAGGSPNTERKRGIFMTASRSSTLKRQKAQEEWYKRKNTSSYSLHNIPSPPSSLDRSPVYVPQNPGPKIHNIPAFPSSSFV